MNLERRLALQREEKLLSRRKSERNWRKGITLASLLALFGVGGYAATQVYQPVKKAVIGALSGNSLDDYLPEGFKDLEMGIDLQRVRELRPFVVSTGTEGVAKEEIEKESPTYENILLALGTNREDYGYTAPLEVRYSFTNNRLTQIEFIVYELDFNPRLGVFPLLGKPVGGDRKATWWEKGDLQVVFDESRRWNRYRIELKEPEK